MPPATTKPRSLIDERRWDQPTLAPVPLGREILRRFVNVQGVDRGVAIGAHAFTALVPLLMIYGTLLPRGEARTFSDGVIERFDLEGASAEALRQALQTSGASGSSVSVIGGLLLLIAALSFTRAVQRLHESSYGLPPRGFRGSASGLAWLVVLLVPSTLRPLIGEIGSDAARVTLAIGLSVSFWTVSPMVLTGRRISAREALPAGLLAAVAMTALGAASGLWLPHSVATSAEQYGLIGVAFAFVSWLVGAGLTLAAATVSGAVLAEAIGARSRRTIATP